MDNQKAAKLKELFSNELSLRSKHEQLKRDIESFLTHVNSHSRDCVNFWDETFKGDVKEIIITMDTNRSFKIKPPESRSRTASFEMFFPYGIDFEEVEVFNFNY